MPGEPTRILSGITSRIRHILSEPLKGRDQRPPVLDLLIATILMAGMVYFVMRDPFGLGRKIIDFLRLKYAIFIQEPRLLFYATIYIGTVIAKSFAAVVIVILVFSRRLDLAKNLGLQKPSSEAWTKLTVPFALCALVIRIYYALDPLVPNLPMRFVFPAATIIGNAILIFSAVVIAPVCEELIFRGYLYDVFARGFGAYVSLAITSAFFSLAHMTNPGFTPDDFCIIFLLGTVFGALRYRTGSVIPAIAFHGVYNGISIAVGAFNYFTIGY